MRRLGFALSVLIASAGLALSADTIPATGGNIEVTPIVHASTQLEHAGKIIHVDPWSQGSDYSKAKPADLILITDIHGDHLDPAAIDKVKKAGTVIVGPAAAAEKLPGIQTIANGETKTFAGVTVEAVPMYNLQRGPQPGQLFHTKGRGNGYVVTLGGKRLYFAGDTECTPEMQALTNIDAAFVPMNLPYTMPPSEAAQCVAAFAPKVVYPYHYRGSKVEEFTAALAGKGVEVRALNWYPAAN
jgi:L-ascorbate metabolism protein UlaG (beta-lactamase superfamily)